MERPPSIEQLAEQEAAQPSQPVPAAHPGFVEDDPSFLARAEVVQGSKPGDVRVRFVRPAQYAFRRHSSGLLEATPAAAAPRSGWERITTGAKRFFIGAPIATAQAEHERLTKFKALAVLSSDAISSVAYATEAILLTLAAAGSGNLGLTFFITLAIIGLLAIVALSYRQTIPAYPNGGGSYIVAKDNLGTLPGLTAAASLMIDYVLTVSVSIAAGVQALATLDPSLAPYVVPIDIALVVLITVVNLRGVKESGTIFALPTYFFIALALLLIGVGFVKVFLFQHHGLFGNFPLIKSTESLSLFLILRSFAAGCSAMTGVEAISNGVPAFKRPETHNARTTLTWMAVILGTLFLGTTILALGYGVEANANGNPTVIGQVAQQVFNGPLFIFYPLFQVATLFILTLAANTSYSDFPRLSSLLARDHYLPHQFAFRGDRLAFSTGILSLAILASLLLIAFGGDTTALINLYAVGVFLSFTLSQGGMVRHWWRLRHEHKGWLRSMLINGLGATATFAVALVISTTKFLEGAWIVVLLIPLLILLFVAIHAHYTLVERERTTDLSTNPQRINHRIVVPIDALNQAARQSLAYARSITSQVDAIHFNIDPQHRQTLQEAWEHWQRELAEDERVPLNIYQPPRRSLVPSLLRYLDEQRRKYPDETLTVLLPEMAVSSHLKRLFAHPRTFLLKAALLFRPQIIVTNVSWREHSSSAPQRADAIKHRIVVPLAELDRVTIQSLAYARSISRHVTAVHVAIDPHDVETIREKWERYLKQLAPQEETHLVVIESPYRSLVRPLLAYVESVQEVHPEETVTVILPEFVVRHWWEFFLHNQTALRLKTLFLSLPQLVVTDIPQHVPDRKKSRGQLSA